MLPYKPCSSLTFVTPVFGGFSEEHCIRAFKAGLLVEAAGISVPTQQCGNKEYCGSVLEVRYEYVSGVSCNLNSLVLLAF